jgi:hypothetical protein
MCTTYFSNKELYILSAERIYGFHMIVMVNGDSYVSSINLVIEPCNGDVLHFIWGMECIIALLRQASASKDCVFLYLTVWLNSDPSVYIWSDWKLMKQMLLTNFAH